MAVDNIVEQVVSFPVGQNEQFGMVEVWNPSIFDGFKSGEDFAGEYKGVLLRTRSRSVKPEQREKLVDLTFGYNAIAFTLRKGRPLAVPSKKLWTMPFAGLTLEDLAESDEDQLKLFKSRVVEIQRRIMGLVPDLLKGEPQGEYSLEEIPEELVLPRWFLERYQQATHTNDEIAIELRYNGSNGVKSPVYLLRDRPVLGDDASSDEVVDVILDRRADRREQRDEKAKHGPSTKTVIERSVDPTILEHVRSMADAQIQRNIMEVACANPYDADATRVTINYDGRELTIADDGSGMSPDDLRDSFFRSGASEKKTQKRSPKFNRARLGSFGLAAIDIASLCNKVEVVTVKGGRRTYFTERFDNPSDPLRHGKKIELTSSKVRDHNIRSGTRVVMKNLKFSPEDFSIASLRNEIRWEIPVGAPNFDVFVNGEKVEPPEIKGEASMFYRFNGRYMGDVEATFHIMGRNHARAGMHVYVNGRRIGDPSALLPWGNRTRTFERRIIGMIKADGLEGAIHIDRARFNWEDKGLKELRDAIGVKLTDVVNYARIHFPNSTTTERIAKGQDGMLESVRQTLSGANVLPRGYKLIFGEDMDEAYGVVDHAEKVLTLNPEHPSLRITSKVTPGTRRSALMHAATFVLSMDSAKDINEFKRSHFVMWNKLNRPDQTSAAVEARDPRHPNRMYTPQEIMQLTGFSQLDLYYLRTRGLLSDSKSGLYLGGEMFDTKARLGLFTKSLNAIAHERGLVTEHNPTFVDLTENRLKVVSKAMPLDSVMIDFSLAGEQERPCYFALPILSRPVGDLIASPGFSIRDGNPVEEFQKVFHAYLPPGKLKALTGLEDVERYMAGAKKQTLAGVGEAYVKTQRAR